MSISATSLIEQLQWRYATKKFNSEKKISAENWTVLEEALILSPSSFGLQPWKFIVVNDKETRKQLRKVSWDQSQIEDASHLVVFAVNTKLTKDYVAKYVNDIAATRGVEKNTLDGYEQMMNGFIFREDGSFDVTAWASRQVYISLGVFLSSCAMLEIDSCPMEGFDSSQYDKILGLDKQNLKSLVVATVGYRADDDGYSKLKKVRFNRQELITHI